jgi:hypothetical protein
MKFAKPWASFPSVDGSVEWRPVLEPYFKMPDGGLTRQLFVVDSGADVSLGPQWLCSLIGLDWDAGRPVQLRGISPREDCAVAGRIHQVDRYILEAACQITVPFCFAEGDAPLLLGREGFFDAFRVLLDKPRYITEFERV